MNPVLHWVLVGVVVMDLVFVAITGVAHWGWLGPLFALSLLAPAVAGLARFRLYRMAWNVMVCGVCGILVHHTLKEGVRNVLEDGLRLAAVCQVHLLNNMSRIHKPDLLFFNSFLIPVVTCYLCLDLEYCIAFLLYVPLLVMALEVAVLTRENPSPSRAVLTRTLRGSLARGSLALACTFLVFLLVPRDFDREGFLVERLRKRRGARHQVGFNDGVRLSELHAVGSNDRVVLRVKPLTPLPAQAHALYWRGATLDAFDGRDWQPASPLTVKWERSWHLVSSQRWRRGSGSPGSTLQVEMDLDRAHRLFIPLSAREVFVPPDGRSAELYYPLPDLTIRRHRRHRREPVRYTVQLFAAGAPTGAIEAEGRLEVHLALPPELPPEVYDVADEISARVPPSASLRETVEIVRSEVEHRFSYLAPGRPGAARSLASFFAISRAGHCEYFATALAVLLRLHQIPCRVVTGFRSAEWDDHGRLLVRSRHAHAWVEVFDPTTGWFTSDATPSVTSTTDPTAGPLALLLAGIKRWWQQITDFDDNSRTGALAWFNTLAHRAAHALTTPWGWITALALASLLTARITRRRRTLPPATRHYRTCLRKLGLQLAPTETPRELLHRAGPDLAPDALHLLEGATRSHELARFRG